MESPPVTGTGAAITTDGRRPAATSCGLSVCRAAWMCTRTLCVHDTSLVRLDVMNISKRIVDFVYGTQRVRRAYEEHHPDETVVASDASKGMRAGEDKVVRRGVNWVASQRAVLLLTDKQIVCGKWNIPLNTVVRAQLVGVRTLLGSAHILKIVTIDQGYFQFGMQRNVEWVEQDALPVTRAEGALRYSPLSLIVRIGLIGYVVYRLILRFV